MRRLGVGGTEKIQTSIMDGKQGVEPTAYLPPIFFLSRISRISASVAQAQKQPGSREDNMSRMSPALCNMSSYRSQYHEIPSLAPSLLHIPYLVIVKSYMFE